MQQKSNITPNNHKVEPLSSRYQVASLISTITKAEPDQAHALATPSQDADITPEADNKLPS